MSDRDIQRLNRLVRVEQAIREAKHRVCRILVVCPRCNRLVPAPSRRIWCEECESKPEPEGAT
jgi:hypothetical protein